MRLDTFSQALGGSAPFPGSFGNQAVRLQTHLLQEGAQLSGRRKEPLEPTIGNRLEVADQFEETQFAVLSGPQRGPQSWTEGIGQDNEEQAAI